jgi:hypothetical protein
VSAQPHRRVGFSPAPPDFDEPRANAREQREHRAHEERRAVMPDATVLLTDQIGEARELLLEDRSRYPRYPWGALAGLSGPMCPGELILIAARTGGGKSLFLQNLFDALIVSGRCGLYAGLEQSPTDPAQQVGVPPRRRRSAARARAARRGGRHTVARSRPSRA